MNVTIFFVAYATMLLQGLRSAAYSRSLIWVFDFALSIIYDQSIALPNNDIFG